MKKPTKTPISSKKPISFLKRHQGVSAWCSRLRKQGLPVTDPAAELLKRQCTNSSQIPIVRKTALKKRLDVSSSLTILPILMILMFSDFEYRSSIDAILSNCYPKLLKKLFMSVDFKQKLQHKGILSCN